MSTESKTKAKSHVTTDKQTNKAERILAIDVGGTGLKAAIISESGEYRNSAPMYTTALTPSWIPISASEIPSPPSSGAVNAQREYTANVI